MNQYKVVWGGSFIGSKNKMDGHATIEGDTFEEAREIFFQKMLAQGIRIGFVGQFEVTFYDLKTGEELK